MGRATMSIAGVSRHTSRARYALSNEICIATEYLQEIKKSTTVTHKMFFLKCLFEHLSANHNYLCNHVGFRLNVLEQIEDAKWLLRCRHYQKIPYYAPMKVAMEQVETIIQKKPIPNAF